jgi:hypothetical protein
VLLKEANPFAINTEKVAAKDEEEKQKVVPDAFKER